MRNKFHLTSRLSPISRLSKGGAVLSAFLILAALFFSAAFTSCEAATGSSKEEAEKETQGESKYTGIKVKTFPSKVKYTQGEFFSTDGLTVNGIKEDGTMEEIPSGWVDGAHWFTSPENGSKLETSGKVTVTVEYTNNARGGVTRSTTFDKVASRSSDIFHYYDSFEITVEKAPEILSDRFFWGTWVRMDSGAQYEILENAVKANGRSYAITANGTNSNAKKEITCGTLGTFTEQSDSVIICDNIPYFRNGGTNLEYSLKLVGFSNGSRAVSQIAKSGLKGLGKSKTFPSFESDGTSDTNGLLKLKAPTANDTQTVSLSLDDGSLMVIPDIMVANSGDYMGTVAIVDPDQYNLKITGKIADYQKDDGYLYGNNTKMYDMTLAITNISENVCKSSVCIIEPDDNRLSISSSENISALDISTMPAGTSRTVNLKVSFGDMTEPYVDTGVKVTLINAKTNQEWSDYVPLRFYKGLIPITVSARNTEKNDQAALNGFIIYPDGNNQFFSVKDNSTSILFVPTFGSKEKYKMVFSGATVTSNLSSSTEMYYSVAPGSSVEKEIDLSVSDYRVKLGWKNYGGENHSEDDAFAAEEAFIAYLDAGDIDYYTLNADSEEFYAPGAKSFYRVSFSTDYGEVPSNFLVADGSTIPEAKLPALTQDGMTFAGWYDGATKVTGGTYTVTGDVTLTARWSLTDYEIEYNLNGGKNSSSNPASYTIATETITLQKATRTGYTFEGWFTTDGFTGDAVTEIEKGSKGKLTLYAKWKVVSYPVYYTLGGGASGSEDEAKNDDENPRTYTIEDEFTLKNAKRAGYAFSGWFTNLSFRGAKVTKINKGTTGELHLYARWLEQCNVNYSTNYVTAPLSITKGKGDTFTEEELPSLSYEGYVFKGWRAIGGGSTFVKAGEYEITGNTTLVAIWKKLVTVNYVSEKAASSVPESITLEEDAVLSNEHLPTLKEDGFKHTGWYSDSGFAEGTKVTAGYTLTDTTPLTLYAKWEEYTGPELTTTVVKLPSGTDGTAGTGATYVLFGDWPQTVKLADVTVDETQSEEHGAFTYYLGSDDHWYVKCTENAYQSGYTYSDGTTAAQSSAGSAKYFKVEPIKWRVLTADYNSTGKALLLAENILTGNVPYYLNTSTRTISSSYVYENNYKYSTIRAYLNGSYETEDTQTKTYQNQGFLQTAFTADAQNHIATANVDNTAASTTDAGGNIAQATNYACANTSDKIFLLSEKEVTTTSYGFTAYNVYGEGNPRIRVTTDFAKANYAYQSTSSGFGGWWWLRSPYYGSCSSARDVLADGNAKDYYNVYCTYGGVVPALSISLE